MKHLSSGIIFSVLGVYLNPDFCIRRFQYDELNVELSSLCKPNVCLGDFNSVRDISQKTGRPPALWPCILFNNFIASNQFVEIHDPDTKFSWSNKREGPANVQSLIDHCFVFHDWWDCREWNFSLRILPHTSYDHNPIVMAAERNHIFTCGKSVFRYFNYWEQFPQCTKLIADCWPHHVAGCPMVRFVSKLQLVRDKLREWSKQDPNDLVRIIKRLRVQVGVAQNLMDRGDLSAFSHEIKLRLTLIKLIKMDEERLRQKARVRWMREGDSNSKFFHAMAKGRQRRNHIRTIMDGERVISDMDEIFASCTTYFKDLLTDNAVLRATTAGPDGFNNHFYQSYWSIIGPDVSLAVKEFFRSGRMVKGINKTHIVLLPKEEGACTMDKFRPISLCNSILKFLTRIMVLRMRPILSRILHRNQVAFFMGRSIQDSFLLSQEVVHLLAHSKSKDACVKIDLSKAYDRVNWQFLKNNLKLLGFCSNWTKHIMTVVSTLSSALLINSKEGSWFFTARGLRQGDPLSPYLFIVTMEILNRSMLAYLHLGKIRGRKVSALSSVHSSFYADDVLVFIEGRKKFFLGLKDCFLEFKACSGLKVNLNKTFVYFFNLSDFECNRLCAITGWKRDFLPVMHLGLTLQYQAITESPCQHIVMKVNQKLAGWKQKLLSYAERLCLVKHVLTSIPSYWMMVLWIPLSTCHQIEKLCSGFIWGDDLGVKGAHLISWNALCKPKVEGGVGLRRMVDINRANFYFLRVKAITQDSLWVDLVRAKYLTKKSMWQYKLSGSESSLWKRVIKCWQLIESQVHWRVNNGFRVKFWHNRWNGVIISNMISPTSWTLIQDTMNCTIKELFADRATYVHMFLESMSIPIHLRMLEDSRQDTLEWVDCSAWPFGQAAR
ncbi:uncharacterized protein LOC116265845 [Nymphaea colorata]|uniref:uncharacterized protein LOC116265845 n=1 Tax=Nymphaea colorata TaxID=210225 RepID=UPI00214E5C55|nr:uncharacterized protein LOC116265845 [Nymphaea colorata]